MFIGILIFFLFLPVLFYSPKILKEDIKQDRLSRTSSEGRISIFKISFNSNNNNNYDKDGTTISNLGGVITFLKSSKKNRAILACINCVKIKKFKIKLDKNIFVSRGNTYLLPENLFKILDDVKNAELNWKYLTKSIYQEFLMINTIDYQKINIEIYNVDTLRLENIFYKEDLLTSNVNKPGIFAITTDSRLFAYSYGDNAITIYLMESGLEVVTRIFVDICEIKFLEFIEEDKKLFIIEQGKSGDVKFHVWVISGCLNDYFFIFKDDIGLTDSNIPTLSKYDELHNTLTKANGKVVFYNKVDRKKFKVVYEVNTERTTFGESDTTVIDEYEYKSSDLEPWNNVITKTVHGRFLSNDRRFLLIIGQNSIQLWKSNESYNFKNFENSNLLYILISDEIKPETKNRFFIEEDMATIIIDACKSLSYLYKHIKNINSKEKHQKFVSGITNIIKDFIKRYPDNWKLLEIQYPLMAYLIYSRSSSLVKYILFGDNDQTNSHVEKLHRPANYNNLKLSILNDLHKDIIDNVLIPPSVQITTIDNNPTIPLPPPSSPDAPTQPPPSPSESPKPVPVEKLSSKVAIIVDKPANDLELALKLKDEPTDGELALEFRQGRDAVILAYLLEYYSENSMNHIGWMINATKILPQLSNDDYYASYMKLLLHKPCFGEMKYNFPIKRFRALSYGYDTLEVYAPLINLIPPNSLNILRYRKLKDVISPDIYMVPLPNFTTHKVEVKAEKRKLNEESEKFIHLLRNIFFPPFYKNLNDTNFSPFLQIKKNERAFFNIPSMEAVINSRWAQTKAYWQGLLYLYVIFLILFSALSNNYIRGDKNTSTSIRTGIGIFYYIGAYLLIIEIMQMKKYTKKYITIFNMFDLFSIIFGMAIFTLILLVKVFNRVQGISDELITILTTVTTLILWIEMLLWFRLFSVIAINIFIFGNILKTVIPFFAFMFIFIIGFGHSMFVLFGDSSLLNLYSPVSTFVLNDGTQNLTLTEQNPDNPFNTIWDAILSMYYMNTINLNAYNYWPLKLFSFIANVIIVLILLNMIIALMNDTFNKAKEDGNLGLLKYRAELIDDFERLDRPTFYNSPYICFRQDPELMKKWINKSQELKKTKLYSWFNESVDKEEIIYDDDNIKSWYKTLVPSNENRVSIVSTSFAPDLSIPSS